MGFVVAPGDFRVGNSHAMGNHRAADVTTHLPQPIDIRVVVFQPYKHYHAGAIGGATRTGSAFNIFTDSQAEMTRLQDDRPGPGQRAASGGILIAREAYRRGASITISWVPGHAGVPGNEVADQWAVEAAMREM